ncbi:MAG: hypothetical protein ACP5RD_05475 [bacterium]
MNFDIIITGNTIGALFTKYIIFKKYKVKIASIIPPISILKNANLVLFSATLRNLKFQFKSILNSSIFKSYKSFSFKFANKSFDIELDKNIFFVTQLENLKQYINSIISENNTSNFYQKIFNNSIKDIYYDNSKWYVKLDNSKIVNGEYLLICDDFWGLSWNILNISLKHNGGWIVKVPNLQKDKDIKDQKIIFSFGDTKKSVILGNSNFIFANYIDKEYSIDNVINKFLLSNFDMFKNYKILSWDKYVLPFSYKLDEIKENYLKINSKLLNSKLFIVSEYLGLTSTLYPDFTYLTSILANDFLNLLDNNNPNLLNFLDSIFKTIEINYIFYKIMNFIYKYPFVFINNFEDNFKNYFINFLLGNLSLFEFDKILSNVFGNYYEPLEIKLSEKALQE